MKSLEPKPLFCVLMIMTVSCENFLKKASRTTVKWFSSDFFPAAIFNARIGCSNTLFKNLGWKIFILTYFQAWKTDFDCSGRISEIWQKVLNIPSWASFCFPHSPNSTDQWVFILLAIPIFRDYLIFVLILLMFRRNFTRYYWILIKTSLEQLDQE